MGSSRRRPQDRFGRRAQGAGFPARSVYKLEEIDRRTRLLRRGLRVLDLGAAPGSWALYAAGRVGDEGKVVAIDRHGIDIALPRNTEVLKRDIFDVTAEELGGVNAFDLVLSDMAPRTSGQRHRDQFLSYELFMRALELATRLLPEKGNFVAKIFQGPEFGEARAAATRAFGKTRILRPEATRRESYEVFIVGLGRKPG